MAAAMAQQNLTMQYCMASPRHFLQGARYSNLTTIRTSADRLGRDRWNDFLYTSRLASALGMWPFTDNFNSTETTHLLIATLSAGPVGIGDPIASISGTNLLEAVRKDGIIVKPDAPLVPLDSSYSNTAHGIDAPLVASTYSDFGPLRTNYIFAYSQGSNVQVKFSPSELGVASPAYLYDYSAGTGTIVNPSDVLQPVISGDSLYLVLAPIGPSGMAIIGDTSQLVPMGKKRIPAITDDGAIHLTVAFAQGETNRVIKGYNRVTKQFQLSVGPGPQGTATVEIQRAFPQSSHPIQRPDLPSR
jgi:hypothetical protein